MKRSIVLALAASAAVLFAGTAQAGGVHWSIGINLPPIATVVSNAPGYYGEPAAVYYPAPAAVYAPAPAVIYRSAPPVYVPPVVVYRAPPPYYSPYYAPRVVYQRPVPVFRRDRDDRRAPRWHGERGR